MCYINVYSLLCCRWLFIHLFIASTGTVLTASYWLLKKKKE